jgi:hypothetical protein
MYGNLVFVLSLFDAMHAHSSFGMWLLSVQGRVTDRRESGDRFLRCCHR